MSGTMRKMGVYLGLLEGAEDDFAYDDEEATGQTVRGTREDTGAATRARPEVSARPRRSSELAGVSGSQPREGAGREVSRLADHRRPPAPVQTSVAAAATSLGRIVTLHPRTYNEAKVIGENFRDGIPVIMDLSEMSDGDAKRLVDFAAGLIFAVHGSIERVTQKVFLLSPPHVSVAAEDKRRIAEGGFFNQS